MYYVYYTDDYPENGGVGFQEFEDEGEAIGFILDRYSKSQSPNLDDYMLIKGEKLKLEVVERVTKIKIK